MKSSNLFYYSIVFLTVVLVFPVIARQSSKNSKAPPAKQPASRIPDYPFSPPMMQKTKYRTADYIHPFLGRETPGGRNRRPGMYPPSYPYLEKESDDPQLHSWRSPFQGHPPALSRNSGTLSPLSPNSTTGVQEEWLRSHEFGLLASADEANDIAVDREGNTYVTGFTHHLPQGIDFYTIKYDPAGNELWSRLYDGGVHNDDLARAIALDAVGNAYVTGESIAPNGEWQITTVKYSADGVQEWVATNPGIPLDMMVDDSANVYVAGSNSNSLNSFYVTIKYDKNGKRLWMREYQDGDMPLNFATAMALDKQGNIYLTGYSGLSWAYEGSCVSIKYDSQGVFQWEAHYPASGIRIWNYPEASHAAIAVDDSANVYVTGDYIGSGDDIPAIQTIKYRNNGEERWVAVYRNPSGYESSARALALDDNGNVYVTGESVNSDFRYDCVTIKYDVYGEQQWTARFEEYENIPRDITVNDHGEVFVGVHNYNYRYDEERVDDIVILKYNTQGGQEWAARYHGPGQGDNQPSAMALNSAGDLLIAGISVSLNTGTDYVTLKYDSQGTRQWERRYNGPVREITYVRDMQLDPRGNIYLLLGIWTTEFLNDVGIIKYNPAGGIEWIVRHDRSNGWDYGSAFVVDGAGNVYVTGLHGSSQSENTWLVQKYNMQGIQEWESRYDDVFVGWREPDAIVLDRSNNVYICGTTWEESEGKYTTIKCNSAGVRQWVRYYGRGEYTESRTSDMAVDDKNCVYISGTSEVYDSSGVTREYITIKYNPDGREEWIANYPGGTSWYFGIPALALDGWGNAFVAGYTYSEETYNSDIVLIKYNRDGSELWARLFDLYGEGTEFPRDLKAGIHGHVYLAVRNSVIKYDPEGDRQWIARYSDGESDWAQSLYSDRQGNVYVTGFIGGETQRYDMRTVKYNPEGQERWAIHYNSPGVVDDLSRVIAGDDFGNIFIAGETRGAESGGWAVTKTLKYAQTEDDRLPVVNEYRLMQNAPNPFNSQTLIGYELPKPGRVSISVYNSLGEKVMAEDLGFQPEGRHAFHLRGDYLRSSGIYFYRIKSEDFVETKKMVLVW